MAANDDNVNILLVDDQPSKLLTYEAILRDLDATLVTASSAHEAFNYLLKNDVAVILVDVYMPELDGFQLASMVRDHPRFEKTAIIFISAIYLSELDRLRGYESGAVDYVPVPVVPEILRAKVKIFLELYRKTRDLERLNRELEDRVAARTAELKASNERLRESEERLRLASEAAEFGTYDCNPRTGRFHCSPQMKQLLGWAGSGELDVEGFLNLVHEADQGAVRRALFASDRTADGRHRVEFRVAQENGTRWLLDCGRAFFEDADDGLPARVMGTVLDLTERKQNEERQLLLMAELDHRVKNILANVGAIAKLSSKTSGSIKDFVDALDARIQAVAKAHSVLRRDSWIGIDLKTYFSELLAPFINRQGKNIVLQGDPVDLSPKAAQSLALVFHELATNAVKYGALSVPNGKVLISWSRKAAQHGHVRVTWQELNGPSPHVEEVRRGFGTTVINAVASELRAEVEYNFNPNGVIFCIEGELEQTGKATGPGPSAANLGHSKVEIEISGEPLRILLVEDELLVALQTKSDLESAGHKVVALATNTVQGLQFAQDLEFDFAVLDIRLGEDVSVPIAETLVERDLPFAFVTGFEDSGLLPRHLHSVPRLTKPYELNAMLGVIAALSRKHNCVSPREMLPLAADV